MKENDLFAPLNTEIRSQLSEKIDIRTNSYWCRIRKRLLKNKCACFGLLLLLFLVIMSIIGPFFSPYTYYDTNLPQKNQMPNSKFWFGTDELGRDLFTRCWWGARISFFVGITASLIDLAIGVLYGALAGFSTKKIDEWMMRIMDIVSSIPYLLVVILLMVIIGPGLFSVIFALSFIGWINMARIVRSQIIQLKQQDYILAAQGFGASTLRIIARYLIPNTIGPIIVTLTFTIPTAIFIEAFLSFLGLGVQAPIASWGTMANDGLASMRYYPWRLFFPAGLITLAILSLNLLGEGLRDTFDPRINP
jgi:oligopeptide transport system permease protein